MATPFNVQEFVGNPSVGEPNTSNATKDQFKFIATSFGIQFPRDTSWRGL